MSQADKARRKALRDSYKRTQRDQAWQALGVERETLDSLYAYVSGRMSGLGCDHSLRFSEEWATLQPGLDWPRFRASLNNAGGYCDCEVLANTDPDQNL